MANRKGKSQARRNGSGGGVPWWAWILSGVLIGLVLSVVVIYREGFDARRLLPSPNPGAQAPREPEPPVAQQSEPAQPKKPKYEFYTVLPEREVVIPDAELTEQAKTATPPAQPANERLLLQAGAFNDARRAEEIKAAIAFTGLVARVEPTAASGGTTVHRVMLGPFASLRELDSAKQQLANGGIQAIAIREPGR